MNSLEISNVVALTFLFLGFLYIGIAVFLPKEWEGSLEKYSWRVAVVILAVFTILLAAVVNVVGGVL